MGRKRSRKRVDSEVIKTQRDSRRADRENDDTFNLTDEERVVESMKYTTAPVSRYLRTKARKSRSTAGSGGPFPFLHLPPEVRNMVYRHLVVSKAPYPIRLDSGSEIFSPGGIETAILLANRTVYNEVIKILYDENKFQVYYSRCHIQEPGVFYRVDDPRAAFATSRQLRNGRSVDMVNHKGLIYKEVFYRLRNVEFHVDLFDRTNMCDHMTLAWIGTFRRMLDTLYEAITDCSSAELSALRSTCRNWSILIHSVGQLGHTTMYTALEPILAPEVLEAVRNGKLKVELEGNFPQDWESIFSDMMGPGFSADDVNVIDDAGLDPMDLDLYFFQILFGY